MADLGRSDSYVELFDTAKALIAREGPSRAAATFGIDSLLTEPELDAAAHQAVYAFLEAQGYQAHLPGSSVLPRFVLAGIVPPGALYAEQRAGSPYLSVVGWTPGDAVVFAQDSRGLVRAAEPMRVAVPQGSEEVDYVVSVEVGRSDVVDVLTGDELVALLPRVQARLRVGAAVEMLGACTRLIDDTVTYVETREQFGRSLSSFAPVQDMLAWAAAERHQLRALVDHAVAADPDELSPMLACVSKALAGRVSRAVVQHTLQANGGIGFTWEHNHHRYHRRTLALDVVGGSAGELTAQIGASVRKSATLPDLVSL